MVRTLGTLEKGSPLYRLIPAVKQWLERRQGEINNNPTQYRFKLDTIPANLAYQEDSDAITSVIESMQSKLWKTEEFKEARLLANAFERTPKALIPYGGFWKQERRQAWF